MKFIRTLSIFMFGVLTLGFSGYGQSGSINKMMNNGDYAGAFEKLNTSYKDTNDVERLELMYRYYSEEKNPSRNLCMAYRYANLFNSQSNNRKLETKELIKEALTEIYQTKDVESAEEFMECFKEETAYTQEAGRMLEQLAFDRAQKKGTLEAYTEYVEKYPKALQSSLAKQEIDRLFVEQILESEDLEKLRDFVKNNENSKYIDRAKTTIEKLVFNQALEQNTVEAYSEYLSEYPNGSFRKSVSQKLEEVVYDNAMRSGKITDLMDFVTANRNHPQWAYAYDKLKVQTLDQLSIAGMKALQMFDTTSQILDIFAKNYLVDTRKSTIASLTSALPALTSSSLVQKAEKTGKNIDILLSKQSISAEDFKTNKSLFGINGNIHSYALVRKYLTQTEASKNPNKQIYTALTLPLQQSKLLPLYIEQKEYIATDEAANATAFLISAHNPNGFCFESSANNRDIYRLVSKPTGQQDTVLLPKPVNSRYDECNPVLSPDQKTLYFSSNAGVNHGGLDIYVSHREDTTNWDNWSYPILLGSEINTPYDDVVLEAGEKEIVVKGGKAQNKKVFAFETPLEFMDGYLLNQNGKFIRGEVLILDSLTLDTLYITYSNSKGYFSYLKPEQAYTLHSQYRNHINVFSSDLSQIVLHDIEDLVSTKKFLIVENPFSDKKRNQLTTKGRRNLEYFAKSVRGMNYTITMYVYVCTAKPDKAGAISEQQADLIAKFLIKNGISKDKIIILGRGNRSESEPIGWEGKDRIEIGFLIGK